MKAKFEFDMNDEDERYRFKEMVAASNMQRALDEFGTYLRSRVKYEENDQKVHETIELIREKFISICHEYDVEEFI